MADHPYNQHREQQVAHRRVHTILSGSPSGAASKMDSGGAYSKVTSKTAAMSHDAIGGKSSPSRFARGGKVKGNKGHSTNIAIVMPHGAPGGPPGGLPPGGPPPMMAPKPPMMPPPGGAPPMGGGMPGLPPGGPPPGMPPMHAKGGRVVASGIANKGNIAKMSSRAAGHSYAKGGKIDAGALTGVGRKEKAAAAK